MTKMALMSAVGLLALVLSSDAFSMMGYNMKQGTTRRTAPSNCCNKLRVARESGGDSGDVDSRFRRNFFLQIPFQFVLVTAPVLSPANAAMVNSQKVFEVGKPVSEEQAVERFKEGRESIQYLLDHYDEICEGGGDNVRRYLGTVGTSSGLYGISKVMKVLMDRADNIVDFTETMNEVNKSIQQADGSAYMSIFVTSSTSYTPPAKYFGDAKVEIKNCIKAMDELAALVGI